MVPGYGARGGRALRSQGGNDHREVTVPPPDPPKVIMTCGEADETQLSARCSFPGDDLDEE
ncbi:hypothetical protein BCONGLO52_28280 [Brachybacterium conglomeratum]|uniref:Uncharacterized protein n=1 Tax=Brachybacterium conglomeratum TaxID=47846 RepID=A0ABQ5RKK6_9MICO|nr:hypothetical protein BCONGLO52_28280 [Brachybacterium conglomeratum]GLK03521.1 hypothetical protein GCM10017597_03200 [Brachybacterium conglomeratum]